MSTITIADKFARTDDFASRLEGAFFADEVWAVFAELEQPATAVQIAERLQESPETVLNAINLLITQQLVRRQLKSWRDFLAQKGTGGASTDNATPPTAPVADARVAGRPGAALAGWPQPNTPVAAPEPAPQPANETPAIAPEPVAGLAEAGLGSRTPASTPAAPLPPETPAIELQTPTEPPPVLFSDFQLPTRPLHETHLPEPAPEAATPEASTPVPATPPRAEQPPPVLFTDFQLPAKSPSAAPAPVPAVVVAPATPAPRPKSTPPVDSGTVMPVSFTIANDKARFERKATTAMTISFRIETTRTAETASTWKLRPLLQAIEQKGGGGLPGQLLVYRVFIHVPAEMMHAAGIQSISLVDDTVVIRDRAFYDALCQAAHAVASVDLRTIPA